MLPFWRGHQPPTTTRSNKIMANSGSVSTATGTGIQNIDALISGFKWASTSLSYAMPTLMTQYDPAIYDPLYDETGTFQPVTGGMVTTIAAVMAQYSAVSGLNISLTSNVANATMLIGRTNLVETAQAYLPQTGPSAGGDVWFGLDTAFNAPIRGDYGWATALHEIGHALGLKHSQTFIGGTGATFDDVGIINLPVSVDRDSVEFTVMSYRSYINQNLIFDYYTNENYGYPQTLMMLDIAALQQMYGADFATNNGNTNYTFSTTTGEMFVNGVSQGAPGANRIFLTIWDGGGIDTYDFSNYTTNLSVDLAPGSWSLLASLQRANLGNTSTSGPSNFASGNVYNALQYQGDARSLIENANGGTGNDTIRGNAASNGLVGNGGDDSLSGGSGNDVLTGGTGSNTLDGGTGTDRASYSFASNAATITFNGNGTVTVVNAGAGISDTLTSIEQASFTNGLKSLRLGVNTSDFNGDRSSDLLIRDSSGTLGLWQIQNGAITQSSVLGAAPGWTVLATGDINGDAVRDVVLVNSASGAITSWQMTTVGTINTSVGLTNLGTSSPWQILGSGDFTRDGTSDILLRNTTTGAVAGWQMQNGNINTGLGFGSMGAGTQFAGAADFNNDGTSDILWRDASTGQASLWLVANGSVSQGIVLGSVPLDWKMAGLGDFNGDGTADILWHNQTTGAVAIWVMQNGQLMQSRGLANLPAANWQIAATGDYNGDGTSDVLLRETGSNNVVSWHLADSAIASASTVANIGSWSVIGV
jgi:FG-GAP-like repeat/RTX calcium-binding nonapeptide repeat (4 copies)